MQCPQCGKESPGSGHCLYCGWREPDAPGQPADPELAAAGSAEAGAADGAAPDPAPEKEALEAGREPSAAAVVASAPPPAPPEPEAGASGATPGPEPASPEPASPAAATPAADPRPEAVPTPPAEAPRALAPTAGPGPDAAPAPRPEPAPARGGPAENPENTPRQNPGPGNADPPPSEPGRRVEKGTTPDSGGRKVEIKKTRARDMKIAQGDNAIFATHVRLVQRETEKGKAQPALSLLELTSVLPPRDPRSTRFTAEEIQPRSHAIASERLLLISSVDAALALSAAHAVVEHLPAGGGPARLLNFDRLGSEECPSTIYALLRDGNVPQAERVVVVDAVSHRGQLFLDHLLDPGGGLLSAGDLREQLKERRMLVICLAPWRRLLERRGEGELPFTHWHVPFLEHLLRDAYPAEHQELERAIRQQRGAGRWSRDDSVFCGQIRSALSTGGLATAVAAGGASTRGGVSVPDEQPVHQAVLFTAAFFAGLSPTEFDRVVTVLLGDQTITLPPAASGAAPAPAPAQVPRWMRLSMTGLGGTTMDLAPAAAPPEKPREKRLAEIWKDEADRVLKACGLAVVRDSAGSRAVGFTDPAGREQLREQFETDHAFSLHARFRTIHAGGLLFDRSDAIAGNVVRLTAEMAAAHSESYGSAWVAGLFSATPRGEKAAVKHTFSRFAELLRGLCGEAGLEPVVAGVLEQFLAERAFNTVLRLVKRLRFAPGFDEFHWLRQLVDRGTDQARAATFRFLYTDVMRTGPRIYPVLHALESWLPADDRPAETYSPANRLALRLLPDYAVDSILRLKPADYGAWPSPYPLLAVTDAESVAREVPLLVRWLLHPGAAAAFPHKSPDEVTDLVAALFAEWTVILYGTRAQPSPPGEGGAAAEPGRDALFAALLEELAARTASVRGRELRRSLLAYWTERMEVFTHLVPIVGYENRALRAEFVSKRGLLHTLLLRFRALQQAHPAPAARTVHA